ncbi:hypothetical protein VTG60DRAFT_2671 [Thermothelomyces hinnuleus]
MELTVAEASGLIAAGVFILQQLLSLVFPAALVGFVREENTAVTWSVLGRSLQSSPWPTILQTDTAARHGVRRRVSNGLTLQTVTMLLISVAAIVTPLGLFQTIEPGDRELARFEFVKDESPFGYATHARLSGPFSRSCGSSRPCPGSWGNTTCTRQGLAEVCTSQFGRAIPETWRSTFREGARQVNESVSSIFDIQWRNQINTSDPYGEWSWYMQSGYRQTGVLVLDPTIQLVDGLIVDAKDGGIGFRNHTAPATVYEYGSTWSEDILFIEPEAQCVNLNLTFDFQLVDTTYSRRLEPRHLSLTDHGGFSALSRTSPDLSLPSHGNGQDPVDLRERAYKAAWANNFLTLAHFNATDLDPNNITRLDVTPGMRFLADDSGFDLPKNNTNTTAGTETTFFVDFQSVRSSLQFGEYLDLGSTSAGKRPRVTVDQFDFVSEVCGGVAGASPANINSSLVGCGLVYGAAYRTDGGDELSPQPLSNWSVPVYSCAASVRATIRTVTFRHNGTGLAGLRVTAAQPKTYASPAEHPVWAVEAMPREYMIRDAQPLWGLLAESAPPALRNNLSTVRQPWLRLPGLVNSIDSPLSNGLDYVANRPGENLPGVDFYALALQNAFGVARPGSGLYSLYGDYSGLTSLAMYSKWRNLTSSEAGAAHLLRLLWTDIAANSVVGTKGWGLDDPAALGEGEGESGNRVRKRDGDDDGNGDGNGSRDAGAVVPVTVYRRRVRYQLPYMVPAIVVLVLAAGVLCTWLALTAMRRTGPAKMRWLLDATSPGRILGGFLWPEKAATLRGTNEWVKTLGTKMVVVGSKGPGGPVALAAGGEEKPPEGDARPEGEETVQLMSKDRPAGTASA